VAGSVFASNIAQWTVRPGSRWEKDWTANPRADDLNGDLIAGVPLPLRVESSVYNVRAMEWRTLAPLAVERGQVTRSGDLQW